MGQTKLWSTVEVLSSTALGFSVSVLAQLLIFPMYDIRVGFSENLQITAWFTIIGLLRSYVVRRVFNRIDVLRGKQAT